MPGATLTLAANCWCQCYILALMPSRRFISITTIMSYHGARLLSCRSPVYYIQSSGFLAALVTASFQIATVAAYFGTQICGGRGHVNFTRVTGRRCRKQRYSRRLRYRYRSADEIAAHESDFHSRYVQYAMLSHLTISMMTLLPAFRCSRVDHDDRDIDRCSWKPFVDAHYRQRHR